MKYCTVVVRDGLKPFEIFCSGFVVISGISSNGKLEKEGIIHLFTAWENAFLMESILDVIKLRVVNIDMIQTQARDKHLYY